MARRPPGGHSGTKKILQKIKLLQSEISCIPVFVVQKPLPKVARSTRAESFFKKNYNTQQPEAPLRYLKTEGILKVP